MRGLRDALRADPVLRRRYVALKRAIVAGGPADPVAFTKAKHDWIAATLAHLGLADEPPRRLYQDGLDPDSPTGAHRPADGPARTRHAGPPGPQQETRVFPVPMQPIHRLAHLTQRADGGVEYACPQCGRYLVRYPDRELVVAAGAPGPVHVLGSGYRDDPTESRPSASPTSSSSTATPWPDDPAQPRGGPRPTCLLMAHETLGDLRECILASIRIRRSAVAWWWPGRTASWARPGWRPGRPRRGRCSLAALPPGPMRGAWDAPTWP
jgi:hypothetical protein